jgi:hypothetical protein
VPADAPLPVFLDLLQPAEILNDKPHHAAHEKGQQWDHDPEKVHRASCAGKSDCQGAKQGLPSELCAGNLPMSTECTGDLQSGA